MTELIKRLYTSIFLITIFILSLYNNYLLSVILIFCIFQIFYEFYNLLKNLFSKKELIKLYILLVTILMMLILTTGFIWLNINSSKNFDKIYIFFLISISITTDIGGYIFGKIFKGKKLTNISPKKTYSGMFGSFITSSFIVYFAFKDYFENDFLFLIILVISAISQFGDIFISYLKRKNKKKDTGSILPGHGGLLDRFDGIIFTLSSGILLKSIVL